MYQSPLIKNYYSNYILWVCWRWPTTVEAGERPEPRSMNNRGKNVQEFLLPWNDLLPENLSLPEKPESVKPASTECVPDYTLEERT